MSTGFKARAMKRGLDRDGEPALLRGQPAGKVHLARNVSLYPGQLGTADDNSFVRYTVATISNDFAPRIGDDLEFVDSGQSFVLDRLYQDNGHTSRFIVSSQ